MTDGSGNMQRLVLAVALIVGALLRIDAVGRLYPATEDSKGDVQRYYVSTAESLVKGRGFETSYEYNFIPPPLQALYLATVKLVLPAADLGTMRAGQALISVATLLIVYRLGLLMSGAMLGASSALVIALDPDVVGLVSTLLAETWFFFLLLSFACLLLVAEQRRAPTWYAGAGVTLGLTCLTKPFPMLLACFIPAWVLLRGRDRGARRGAVAFVVGFTLIVAPWTARNALRYHGFYPISTNGGVLLAQSNFAGLDPTRADMIYWEDLRTRAEWRAPAIEAKYAEQRDADGKLEWNRRDRDYAQHARRFILHNPVRFLGMYAVKLRNVLWYPSPDEPPDRLRYTALGEHWPFPAFRQVLVALGLLGVAWFAVDKRNSPSLIMVCVFGYFWLFSALLHITRDGRINLPLKVILSVFAAYFVLQLGSSCGRYGARLLRARGPTDREAQCRDAGHA